MKFSISLSCFLALLFTSHLAIADFPDTLKKHFAPDIIKPFNIYLESPALAEEKSNVTISILSVQLPTFQTKVTEVSFYSHLKPNTPIMTYKLSNNTLADGLKARIKMSHGTNIIYAVARLDDGSVIGGETITKAINGCNGGF